MLVAAFLAVATYAQAQVAFNPKVGVNFSKTHTKGIELSQQGVKAGINAGLDFRIGNPANRVFFQPGLHYYYVGSNFKFHATDNAGNEEIKANFKDIVAVHSLKVPINAGVYLN